MLRYKGKIYLPERMRIDVLARYHDDPLAGHFEVEKTLNLLQRKYYWPNPGSNKDKPTGMRKSSIAIHVLFASGARHSGINLMESSNLYRSLSINGLILQWIL